MDEGDLLNKLEGAEEMRSFWAFVDKVSAEVAAWPAWMRTGLCPDCCGHEACRSRMEDRP